MIVTIHQPNYLPWIGMFSKIKKADCFIIADTFPYTNHSMTNRNRIRTSTGWNYLTIPIERKFHMSRICDVLLPADNLWREIHLKSIHTSYGKTNFFDKYRDFFEDLYRQDSKYLWEINVNIILYLLKCFKIDVKIFKSSELDLSPNLGRTDVIISLTKAVGADTYLSGPSGKDYLEFEKFESDNLKLKYFAFQHPVYQQRFPGFVPNMSAIDLLFNRGPKSGHIVEMAGGIEDNITAST